MSTRGDIVVEKCSTAQQRKWTEKTVTSMENTRYESAHVCVRV